MIFLIKNSVLIEQNKFKSIYNKYSYENIIKGRNVKIL